MAKKHTTFRFFKIPEGEKVVIRILQPAPPAHFIQGLKPGELTEVMYPSKNECPLCQAGFPVKVK